MIGRLHLEGWLEEWVRNVRAGAADLPTERPSVVDRIRAGLEAVRDIVGRVWIWVIVGIAVGAFIHGYVPDDLIASIMGKGAWWSVPAVVLIGVPIYSNAAGIIPVVEALLGKGAALGTVLAFMMSVMALSFPEMVILRKVLTLKLIAVFVGGRRRRHRRRRLPVQRLVRLKGTSHENRQDPRLRLQALHGDSRHGGSGSEEARRRIALEKVTDFAEIAGYGIAATPGVVIDGKVVHAGGLPKPEDMAKWLKA